MGVLVLISDFGAWREVCLSACYHAIPLSRTGEMLDASIKRLEMPPVRAELYLSEVPDDRLARVFTDFGIQLATTPDSPGGDLPDLYEAKTPVPFERLQVVLKRYGRLTSSFAKRNMLAA